MKMKLPHPILRIVGTSLLSLSFCHAATYYWDGNGNTAGFGNATGTWAAPTLNRWTTRSAGDNNIIPSLTTSVSDDVHFATDALILTTGTVTVDGTVSARSITFGSRAETITLSGGTINLGAAATITSNTPVQYTQSIHSNLSGAGTSLTITGGTLLITGNNSYSGQTIFNSGTLLIAGTHSGTGAITLNGGILNLGNSTSTGSLAATVLNVNGGEFRYTRNDNATQSFNSTHLNSTQATFVVNTGNTLNLGTISRTVGTTPSLSYTGLGTLAASTASNSGGIIPGLHFNNSWAVANGPGSKITGLASYTQASVAGTNAASYTAANIDVDSSAGTLSTGINANSIRFSTAAANILSLTGPNTLAAGGILVSGGVGSNLSTITGGSLAGAAGKDLHVILNNSASNLNIASSIANNGTPTPLTKSGTGTLTLSNSNTFTGGLIINDGEVALAHAGALNSSAGSENAVLFTKRDGGTLSLKGNSVTLRSLDGVSIAALSSTHTVQNAASGNATLTIGNSLNLNSTFDGPIQNGTGGGTLALVKRGTGMLTLTSSSNTYTGGTTIHEGTLVASRSSALGSNTITFAGNSTFRPVYDSNPTLTQNIFINSGVTAKFDSLNQYYKMRIDGQVSGTGTLWIAASGNGNGEVNLNNTNNNHSGPIRIGEGANDGNLVVMSLADANNPIEFGGTSGSGILKIYGTSARNFSQRTFTLSGTTGGATIKNFMVGTSRLVTIAKNLAITGVGNKTLTLGGTNTGNNAFNGFIPDGIGSIISFTKEGTGKWILSKTANTYSGPTRIMEGMLEVKKLSDGGFPSSIGQSGNGLKNLIFGPADSTLRYTGTGDSTDRNFTLLGNTTLDSSGNGPLAFDHTGIISPDVTGLVGTFFLGNATVSGLASTADLMVGMAVTSDAFIGTKTITAINSNSSITLNSGSGILFGTFGLTVGQIPNRTLTLAGSQTGANTISGTLQDSANHSSSSSPGVLNILKQDAGTWRLDGLNTYTGNTTVTAGTLEVAKLADGGEPSSIGAASSDAANLKLGNGTTLLYTGEGDSTNRSFTINGTSTGHQATINASGTDPVSFTNTASPAYGTNNQTRALNLRGSNTGANTLAAHIANNGSGTVSIGKTDAGTWVLSGNNSYTGMTTVIDGTLLVNGDQSLATGEVTIHGTATLGGGGTIGGNVTLATTSKLAPGASIGTLSIGGNLTLSALAGEPCELQFDLGPVIASDKIAVTGTVNIATGVLGFDDFAFTMVDGFENGTYKLITSAAAINGTLDGSNLSGPIGDGGTGSLRINGTAIELVVSGIVSDSPHQIWSDGAAFSHDSNGDGVSNGLAFLLGAADPSANARDRLPVVTENNGGLMLNFSMLKATKRGSAALHVQHCGGAGNSSAWIEITVPETSGGPINGVTFSVSENGENPDLNDVTATISSSAAADGKLFGRLKATE